MAGFYTVQSQKGSRPITLYPPAFGQFGQFGQFGPCGMSYYAANGSTHAKTLSDGTATGFDKVRPMLEGSYQRVNWHSSFWPGYPNTQSAFRFLPSWLQLDIANGWEARITEFGWIPDCFGPWACPNRPGRTANLDDTAPSCDDAQPAISGAVDYNAFVRNYAGAGGAVVWLLSAPSGFDNWAAVPEGNGAQPRPWFTQYIDNLNAE